MVARTASEIEPAAAAIGGNRTVPDVTSNDSHTVLDLNLKSAFFVAHASALVTGTSIVVDGGWTAE